MPRAASEQAGAQTPPAVGAQQTPPAGGQGRGGGGRGGFAPPTTVTPYDDYTGFTKIFDGKTFTNWDGERDVWSIVDGLLHADTTKTPGQHHIHYRGPNAVMRDFTVKVEFKISASGANGGIQYRSRLLNQARGGSIADPLGKAFPPTVTTVAEAVAAGLVAAPAPRGGGPGGGRGNAPGDAGGRAGGGAPGAAPPAGGAGAPAPPAPPPPNPCVGQVGNLSATPPAAGRGTRPRARCRPAIPGR